jgi:tRNA(Ile)-lysidine synthase
LLAQGKADYILLAHHEDDEAETVLFRLARGTSLTGAAAMQEENGKYLRPFLNWSKAEILEYAKRNNLNWREDRTNGEEIATRNKLRLRVLPALEEAVPAAKRNLARFALTSREDDECLYELAKELIIKKTPEFSGDSGYRVQACAKKPMFTRACLLVLKELGVKVDYTKENLEELYRLQSLETGVWRQVKAGVFAVKQYDELAFFTATAEETVAEIPFQVGVFGVGRYAVSVTKEKTGATGELAVDGGKIPVGAVFRLKREGDAFEKFGGGTKSLKKYLVDKKIPCKVRAELPVLAFGNEALAVLTVEISQKLKITNETKEILYLSAKAKGDTNDGNS